MGTDEPQDQLTIDGLLKSRMSKGQPNRSRFMPPAPGQPGPSPRTPPRTTALTLGQNHGVARHVPGVATYQEALESYVRLARIVKVGRQRQVADHVWLQPDPSCEPINVRHDVTGVCIHGNQPGRRVGQEIVFCRWFTEKRVAGAQVVVPLNPPYPSFRNQDRTILVLAERRKAMDLYDTSGTSKCLQTSEHPSARAMPSTVGIFRALVTEQGQQAIHALGSGSFVGHHFGYC